MRPSDDHFHLLRIFDRLERCCTPRNADADVAADCSDPVESGHLVIGIARADERLEERTARESSQDAGVTWSFLRQEICRSNAAGTRHDLHDDRRVARDMPT